MLLTLVCSDNAHYENMPMQYKEIFKVVKNENFQEKINDIFLIFAQNIYCWYTLEPLRRGSSNESQSMFWSKNRYYPCIPQFHYIKVGYKGVFISWTCFPDDIIMQRGIISGSEMNDSIKS